MSNRIRNHVLEERSVAFLRLVIPDSWTIHTFVRDYGIDVQIEIFTENGNRTGIRYYGQLKATDKNESDDLLRLDRSHFEYWSGHTDPVALFRYFDKSSQLSWCWLHDVVWRLKPGNDSLDIASLLKPWVQDISPHEVEEFLNRRRQALFEPLTPPYGISVECLGSAADDAPVFAAKIAHVLKSKSFRVLPKSMIAGHFQLVIAQDKIVTCYCGLPGFIFSFEGDIADDNLVGKALLATFLCACRYERILFARSLAYSLAPLLYESASEVLRSHFIDAMVFAMGLKSAVAMLSPLIQEESNLSLAWFTFATTCATSSWRYGEAHSWIDVLRQWLESPPFPNNSGTFAYNLGNALANQGDWSEALTAYTSALSSDPSYGDRPYYWAEIGATNFECENYEEAARCYEKALSLDNSSGYRWRLADTLFNAGKYKQASEQFKIALPEIEARNECYAELIMYVCDELLNVWGVESQTLSNIKEVDHEMLQKSTAGLIEKELIDYLQPLMNQNAIDPLLNFNAGVLACQSGHYSIAMHRFLTCALRQRGDVAAWANAIKCSLNAQDIQLTMLIAKTAHFYLDERFLPSVLDLMSNAHIIPEQLRDSWRSLIMSLVSTFEQTLVSEKYDSVLRIHDSDATKEFKITSPQKE